MGILAKKEVSSLKKLDLKIQKNNPKDRLIDFDTSIETRKKKLAEDIHRLYFAKNYKQTYHKLEEIKKINNRIQKIISNEKNLLKTNKDLDSRFLKTLKKEFIDTKQANKILESLIEVLPDFEKQIQQYLNMGLVGLHDVRLMLDEIEGINVMEIETLSLIFYELKQLSKNLNRQNKTIDLILEKPFLRVKKLFDKRSKKQLFTDLFKLFGNEFMLHNKFLRNIGYHNKLVVREDNDFKQVDWLEEVQVHLVDELSMLLNLLEKPKLILPFGNLACFWCSKKEALQIIKDKQIRAENILQLYSMKIKAAFVPTKVDYIGFKINKTDEKLDYAFVFPMKKVLENNFFFTSSKDFIKVIGRGISDKKIQDQLHRFDEFIITVNKRFEHLLESYEKINSEKRKRLEHEFTKNLISQMKQNKSLIYLSMVELSAEKDLSEISIKKLIKLIEKAKKHYKKLIEQLQGFFQTDFKLDIAYGFFAAPRKEVINWEKNFKKVNYRPDVYYYKSKNEVIDVESIKINPGVTDLPEFNCLPVKDLKDNIQLRFTK